MKRTVLWCIRKYQKYLSPDTGFLKKVGLTRNVCAFYPTCSEYTFQAVEKYGVYRGLYKGLFRVFRCHPWQKKHIDLLK